MSVESDHMTMRKEVVLTTLYFLLNKSYRYRHEGKLVHQWESIFTPGKNISHISSFRVVFPVYLEILAHGVFAVEHFKETGFSLFD